MRLVALSPIDTRAMFRPVSTELVALLRGLQDADWNRPTMAGCGSCVMSSLDDPSVEGIVVTSRSS